MCKRGTQNPRSRVGFESRNTFVLEKQVMKTLLMVAAAAMLTLGASGCNCMRGCHRPACAPACAPTDPCLGAPSMGVAPGAVITPGAVVPGPETYTPAPANP
jgi:hypothetical protein